MFDKFDKGAMGEILRALRNDKSVSAKDVTTLIGDVEGYFLKALKQLAEEKADKAKPVNTPTGIFTAMLDAYDALRQEEDNHRLLCTFVTSTKYPDRDELLRERSHLVVAALYFAAKLQLEFIGAYPTFETEGSSVTFHFRVDRPLKSRKVTEAMRRQILHSVATLVKTEVWKKRSNR